ncbi:MAG: hypothetical protein WA063_02085 [Minisyncoccia bacterium]
MLKIKIVKKIIGMFTIFAFLASLVPAVASTASATESEDDNSTGEVIAANDMLHFKLKVRWGNVIGDITDASETNFNGSITVADTARVSLENTLKFETHNQDADKIGTTTDTSVPWKSLTYSDWDGVMVTISAPASSSVVITAGGETITKTAEELYSDQGEIVEDAGSGREVVVQSYKASKHPSFFLKVFWGKIERDGYGEECVLASTGSCKVPLLDATGSFKIESGGKLNLVKTLRFEWPDKIVSKSDTEIAWQSALYGGIDGILVHLKLNADELDASDKVTINFDKHAASGFPKSYSIVDLYHNGITKDVISGTGGYGVAYEVWKRPNKSIVRIKDKPTVYVVEDGVKMPIQSPAVLSSNGLTFDDVEVVDQEEADTYADAEPLNYADGTMVREENKAEVYVIANGEKKHILDPIAFTDLGYNWSNVLVVAPKSLGIFKDAAPMNSNSTHPEGALIRVEGAPTVYVVEGGKRIPISDIKLFNARKYDWSKVLVVKEKQAKKFDVGTNLSYPDGSLIKDATGKVYAIDHGEKRWIRSSEDFNKAGYKEKDIVAVDNSASSQLPEGSDIIVNDIE